MPVAIYLPVYDMRYCFNQSRYIQWSYSWGSADRDVTVSYHPLYRQQPKHGLQRLEFRNDRMVARRYRLRRNGVQFSDNGIMNKPDCPFDLADGKWTCPQCGWVYPLESAKPPYRTCPKAPPVIDRVLARIRSRLDKATTCTAAEWDAIESRVRVCCACPFGKFTGGTCRERGTDCTKFDRWFERVTIGNCLAWTPTKRTCKGKRCTSP